MSWQAYIDKLVAGKAECSAIHGINGEQWACSSGMHIQPDEVSLLVSALAKDDQGIYQTGVIVNGQHWTVVRMEPDIGLLVLKGKETSRDLDNRHQHLIVAVSSRAVIFGANKDEHVNAGTIRNTVESLRDYLKQCGY
ncbi:profilin-like [Gigantopelta aegis]|uniref:profilin-like n=1 Tax=Gigantopelta aegis TaxID=1735272 RepID=UPI001B889673|nr:profilin-like [Gigantopelta aegis]